MKWLSPFPTGTSSVPAREFLMQQVPNEDRQMIPAEAVEAAAKGIWQYHETSAASNSAEPTDEDLAIARAALEAAAPYIIAHTATHLADGMRSWAGIDERAYVQGFAEAATESATSAD